MNILIFDTETLGTQSQDLLNIGYHIVDMDIFNKRVEVLRTRDMLDCNLYRSAKKLFNHKGCLENDMESIMAMEFLPVEKYEKYESLIAQEKIEKHTIQKCFDILKNDIKKYNVVFGYAYNCLFDIDKFKKTALKYQIENPLENLPIFDIWAYATNHICATDDYKKWAKENEAFTQTEQYISTSVETVIKYLTNNIDFVEDHTALSDTAWELKILLECVARGCDITREEKKIKNIPSEKVFHKTIILPNKEIIEFDYKKSSKDLTRYY